MAQDVSSNVASAARVPVYGMYALLIIISLVFVFNGPFRFIDPLIFGILANYLVIGAVWGVFFVPRLWIRSRLYMIGLRLTGGEYPEGRRPYRANLDDLKGWRFHSGVVMGSIVVAGAAVVYAILWPVVALIELTDWSERPF